MKTRTLGFEGPQVSAIGLGCMGFSEFYASSAASEAEAIAVLGGALALGLTFLDTADIYGPFTNEMLVGKAIAGHRDQVFSATKFGIVRDPGNPQRRGINGKPDYVHAALSGTPPRRCQRRMLVMCTPVRGPLVFRAMTYTGMALS
jgi:aryl-alcohol dehydrogenase-like predicted oxidoreductase